VGGPQGVEQERKDINGPGKKMDRNKKKEVKHLQEASIIGSRWTRWLLLGGLWGKKQEPLRGLPEGEVSKKGE